MDDDERETAGEDGLQEEDKEEVEGDVEEEDDAEEEPDTMLKGRAAMAGDEG